MTVLSGCYPPRASVAAHMRSPGALSAVVDALCDALGAGLNNGVYHAGFATSQAAYAAAEDRVVACLVACAARLRASRFLCRPVLLPST